MTSLGLAIASEFGFLTFTQCGARSARQWVQENQIAPVPDLARYGRGIADI